MSYVASVIRLFQWMSLAVIALMGAVVGTSANLVLTIGGNTVRLNMAFMHMAILLFLFLTLLRTAFDDDYLEHLWLATQQAVRNGGVLWLLFLGWAVMSIAWSLDQSFAFYSTVLLALEIFASFVIASLTNRNTLGILCLIFLLAAVPQAVIAIVQSVTESHLGLVAFGEKPFDPMNPFGLGPQAFRPYALATHPNVLGGYLSFALMMGAVAAYSVRRRIWISIGIYVVMAVVLLGLVTTLSRVAIAITLGVMTPALLIAYNPRGRALLLTITGGGLVGVVLIFIAFATPILEQIVQRFRVLFLDPQGVLMRILEGFPNTYAVYSQHPLRGVGIYNLSEALRPLPLDRLGTRLPAHNVYMVVAAELGIVGLVLYASGLWFPLRRLFRRDGQQFLLLASLLALSLMILFEFYFWLTYAMRPLTFWLLGMIWGLQIQQPEPVTDETIGVRTQPIDPSSSAT